jgi:regulator of sigma E protease
VSLAFKPPLAQILVLAAGVIANMLLAWLLFSYAAGHGAPIAVSEQSTLRDRAQVVITGVVPGSPAEIAGVQVNDRLLALGTAHDTLTDVTPSHVTTFIQAHVGEKVTATLMRTNEGQAQTRTLEVTPVQGVGGSTKPAVGIAMGFLLQDDASVGDALVLGAYETYRWLGDTVYGMWSLLAGAVMGTGNLKDISGPVGIAGQVGNWYSLGLAYLAYFTAIISVNLAIINLLPLPALDGGRIVFVVVESIIRRRLPASATSFVNTVGFMLLIALMLVVTWNDVWKLVS